MSRPTSNQASSTDGRTMRQHLLLATLLLTATGLAALAQGCEAHASAASEPVAALSSAELRTTCADGPVTRGIDVSKWQGTVNWDQVSGSGVRFAFIRVSDGVNYRDGMFSRNWTEARRVGIHRGAYQFFRPNQDVAAQANIMIEAIRADGGELAPVIDVEAANGRSAAQITAGVREWIRLVQAATGRTPIIYTGPYFWRDSVGNPDMSGNPLWIAHYGPRCPLISEDVWSRWDFWQYTDSGRVPGISGPVDMNYFNGTLEELGGMPTMPPPTPSNGDLSPPIDTMRVTSYVSHTSGGRGVRFDCASFTRSNHKGTDFGVARGTPVLASAAGLVVRAVDGCSEGNSSCGGSFGNHVIILHEDGRATLYAHLTSGSVSVRRDQRVTCGQQIGLSGNTGRSTGPHLHYEVRDGVRGTGDGAVASYYSRRPTDPYGGACSSQPADLWAAACNDTGPRDDSAFVSAAHPRTVTVAPGENLTQAWRLRNSGTTTWTTMEDYRLTHVSGPTLDGLSNVGLAEGDVAPNAEARFEVTVRAPAEGGEYVSVYRMTHGDNQFGVTVRINIKVAAPRACSSMTLGRSVPSGSCVQVGYPACGISECAWFRCNDGAWVCTEQSACAGERFARDTCAPPVACDTMACGDCAGAVGCTWCEASGTCVADRGEESECGGPVTNDPMACMACYDVGFACAADNQCCGWTAGGSIECMDGFCEDTTMCGANGDTCVDADPESRCCGLAICSQDEGGTFECCTRAGERCTSDDECCGYMQCGADGFCAPQGVGESCRSSQECEGASFCTDGNVCGFS